MKRTILAFGIVSSLALPAQARQDVGAFVRQTFIHGVPYAEAARFGPQDVPALLALLENPEEEEYWVNAVAVLGNAGGPAAVEPMISFLGSGPAGILSHAHYKAKSGVLLALGYAVHKTGSPRAFEYLRGGLDPEVWRRRALPWRGAHFPTLEEQHRQLVILSLIGLGLAGTPESEEAIRAFERKEGPSSPYSSVIEEVLRTHAKVAAEGLDGYYR